MILFGETSRRKMVSEFLTHYHIERNHQGLDNKLTTPIVDRAVLKGTIRKRERLGGMLSYYYREAA